MNYVDDRLLPYLTETELKATRMRKKFKGFVLTFFILALVALTFYIIGLIAIPVYYAFMLVACLISSIGFCLLFFALIFYAPKKANAIEAHVAYINEQLNLFKYGSGPYLREDAETVFVETMEATIKEGY